MKFKLTLLLLLFISHSTASAQKKESPQSYASIINPDGLKQHLQIIASAEMEGRGTATEGERKAAVYLQQEFVKMGLQLGGTNGLKMPFNVYRDSLTFSSLTVNGISFNRTKDYGVYTDMNHPGKLRFSKVVFAGYGITTATYNDYKDLDVTGKLVIVIQGEPMKDSVSLITGTKRLSLHAFPFNKVVAATKAGAAGLLIVQKKFPMQFYDNTIGSMSKSTFKDSLPVSTHFISEEITRLLLKKNYETILMQEKTGSVKPIRDIECAIELNYDKQEIKYEANNVIAVLDGTDKKDEYLFITAHYDHIGIIGKNLYYGADDDGSGTAAVLKIAEAFAKAKQNGQGPRRTIVFVLFSGEEQGKFGSEYYSNNPIYLLDKTTANLNIDMIGRTATDYLKDKDSANYIYIIGNDKLSSDLQDISEDNNKATRLKLDYKYNDLNDPNRFYYRSDHYNFARKGVPVLFYFNGVHPDYHRPTDTIDKINFELMSRRAQLVFYTAWQIANMDKMPKRDKSLELFNTIMEFSCN